METNNINAGDLRHMVTIQRTQGPIGTPFSVSQSPLVLGPYCCLVEQLGGSETVNANQTKGLRSYKITMRNRQVNPTDVIVWKGRNLNVKSSISDPFGIMTVVEATENLMQQ